jgi:hypothetical protein
MMALMAMYRPVLALFSPGFVRGVAIFSLPLCNTISLVLLVDGKLILDEGLMGIARASDSGVRAQRAQQYLNFRG